MTNSILRIHPNIWLLITHLKKEETLAQMKRTHYERGDVLRHQGKKYATINDRLQHVVSRYDPDDKIAFLKSIALNLHSFWRLWLINAIHVINLSDQDDKIYILKSIAPKIKFSPFWMCQISINFFCVCLSFLRILLYWFWTFMQLMFFMIHVVAMRN